MPVKWLNLALPAIGIIAAIAAVIFAGRPHPRQKTSTPQRELRPGPTDRLDRRVTHYRASGVLPRWDP
jgi:hypothetical protein